MKVKDLRPESKVEAIELTVTSKGDVQEIERVQANDRVRISNGWVREWRGNLQVSAGRYGRLEVLK
ncbi:MAG: hypothetical protein E6K10_03025 [Methanobacteriota archaeon]|nr:MAG: hypothetical protein E6K10_03025 [Euryarchaeota archaeon]